MKLTNYKNVILEDVTMDGAKGTKIRWLISQKDGAPNFATRLFEVDSEGFTPYHSHSWEHENFILEGFGSLVTEDGDKPFQKGDVIYVPPFMKHSYKNTGDVTLKFLCIIPNEQKVEKKPVNPFATGVANNC
jgi:quercetin dioxygenase-like cupin family protein